MDPINVTGHEKEMTYGGDNGDGNNSMLINMNTEVVTDFGNHSISRNEAEHPLAITLVILMSCISLLGTLGNVLLVIRLTKRFKLDLRARFMMGTVFSALLIAAIFQPINIFHLMLPDVFQRNHQLCVISFALRGICVLCHISSVCVSSVSNYIYINYPLRGSKWLTLRRVVTVNTITWMIIITNILGIYVGFVSKRFTFTRGCDYLFMEVPIGFLAGTVYGVLVPLLLLSMAVNIRIIFIAQRHIHHIGKNTPSSSEIGLSTLNTQSQQTMRISEGQVKTRRKASTSLKTRWRQSKPHVIFLLVTVIFWIPCLIGASMVVFSNALNVQAIKKYLLFALIGVGFGSSSLVTLIEFRRDIFVSNCVSVKKDLLQH